MAFPFSRLLTASSMAVLLALPFAAGAATITVTETADSYDGSVCSLRNAIESINQGADFGGCSATDYGSSDTINLTAQTYVLSVGGDSENNNVSGDLDIRRSVTIIGAGSTQTAISASGLTEDDQDRVIEVTQISDGPIAGLTVNLQGLTVRDGNVRDGAGLAINLDNVITTLTDVVVTNNTASDDAGGIENDGTLVLVDSTVDRNISEDQGGGIRNFGELVVINSTISRNRIVINERQASGEGGGIYNFGEMVLINSTISGNTAQVDGGGIYSNDGSDAGVDLDVVQALLFNVTIVDNEAVEGFGGGICLNCGVQPQGLVREFRVANSLIAQNIAGSAMPDCGGSDPFVSGGYNLIGDASDCNGFAATGDQVNIAEVGVGPLQNNGGPTETHALLMDSPAVDKGNDVEGCQTPDIEDYFAGNLTLLPMTEDQRGLTRPVAVLNPNVKICDIGAYELQVEEPSPTPTPVPPPPGPSLLEGSGCSLSLGGSSAGALSLVGFFAVAALFAAWRGFGLSRR